MEQINASSMRGVPTVPPPPTAPRSDVIWVPDRYVAVPGDPGGVHVPAHWERVTPEGYVIAPPMTVVRPSTGTLQMLPGRISPLPPGQRP